MNKPELVETLNKEMRLNKSDHKKIFCVPKIYLKNNLGLIFTV